MVPEQTAQAAIDLNAKYLIPVHWGKFKLANHQWNEPIERIKKSASELNLRFEILVIGKVLEF